MAERESGYGRVARDAYDTPTWVFDALLDAWELPPGVVWEPAAGTGRAAEHVESRTGRRVVASDVEPRGPRVSRLDFLTDLEPRGPVIITNPPYGNVLHDFARRAVALARRGGGGVALLLPASAGTPMRAKGVFETSAGLSDVLQIKPRIVWFDQDGAAPSKDHAWFCWRFDRLVEGTRVSILSHGGDFSSRRG